MVVSVREGGRQSRVVHDSLCCNQDVSQRVMALGVHKRTIERAIRGADPSISKLGHKKWQAKEGKEGRDCQHK